MKKIILILFLFLSCYLIYNVTEDKNLSYIVIGDRIADNPYLKNYNNDYINENYRIIDLINILKYNQELEVKDKRISIHRLLKNSNILIISIGMNDIYYKLNYDTKNIYTYMNEMINNIEKLLSEIDRYNYEKVLFLGYYNITNENDDIFTYLNYKAKKIVDKYNYKYIDLNNILKNNPKYYQNNNNFNLNTQGYNEINKIIVEKLKKY